LVLGEQVVGHHVTFVLCCVCFVVVGWGLCCAGCVKGLKVRRRRHAFHNALRHHHRTEVLAQRRVQHLLLLGGVLRDLAHDAPGGDALGLGVVGGAPQLVQLAHLVCFVCLVWVGWQNTDTRARRNTQQW
jgi:threonine/homoserine/homoserine lactone efflux protein